VKDVTYQYDRVLYGRSFLNCYQRQSLVMLAERVPHLYTLFHGCLISTDEILEQVVRIQRPRYAFESRFFDAEQFVRIGVIRVDAAVEDYSQARPLLLDTVREQGFAIPVVDVFYLPHCPEYRGQHVVHTVTLRAYDAGAGEWSILDDNRASVLCEYRYPEAVIAASYDNNELRRVRYFRIEPVDPDQVRRDTGTAFAELLEKHEDSHRLLSSVEEILTSPWIAPERALALLHDAFSVYQGSRVCLREYTRRATGDAEVDGCLELVLRRATDVQNQLLVGKVTGSVDVDRIASTGRELSNSEQELVHRLQTIARQH
jgi:hypothetical protein